MCRYVCRPRVGHQTPKCVIDLLTLSQWILKCQKVQSSKVSMTTCELWHKVKVPRLSFTRNNTVSCVIGTAKCKLKGSALGQSASSTIQSEAAGWNSCSNHHLKILRTNIVTPFRTAVFRRCARSNKSR